LQAANAVAAIAALAVAVVFAVVSTAAVLAVAVAVAAADAAAVSAPLLVPYPPYRLTVVVLAVAWPFVFVACPYYSPRFLSLSSSVLKEQPSGRVAPSLGCRALP